MNALQKSTGLRIALIWTKINVAWRANSSSETSGEVQISGEIFDSMLNCRNMKTLVVLSKPQDVRRYHKTVKEIEINVKTYQNTGPGSHAQIQNSKYTSTRPF